jgi:L-ascorbate metabolism protein UlaG (beta-lactamase superfamily)
MFLTWYGHAAFLLEDPGKDVRVVLDPYRTPDVGTYAPIDDWADVVAVSHENQKYHSYVAGVRGRKAGQFPEVVDGIALLDAPQPQSVHGVPFNAARAWEDDTRLQPVAMIGVTLGGLCILHMGDCGHALSGPEAAACGSVDVLLALAGGPPTIALFDLMSFIERLQPRVVIPMHFGNEKVNLNLQPVETFLDLVPPSRAVRRFDTPTIEITKESLPAQTEVWVLPPAR